MENNIDIIIKSNLFHNISNNEIIDLLIDFKYEKKYFEKGNIIIDMGDEVDSIYIIINGQVEISKEYDDTRKNIVNILDEGEIFAEALALSTNKISYIQAISLNKSEIIKINVKNIFNAVSENKNIFIENLLRVISDKNKFLAFKNDILSQKSLRSKIILYLKYMSNIQKTKNIIIPYKDRYINKISEEKTL